MNRTIYWGLICAFLILAGCAGRTIPESMSHQYMVNVIDTVTHQPISGADITYSANGDIYTVSTNVDGETSFTVDAKPKKIRASVYVTTEGLIDINAPGYSIILDETFHTTSQWRYGNAPIRQIDKTIELEKADSCINDNDIYSYGKSFVRTIKITAKSNELRLTHISSNIYKNDCYLLLNLKSTLKFNNNIMSDYDVAKYLITSIFEVIRMSESAFKHKYNYAFTVDTIIEDFGKNRIYRPLKIEYYIDSDVALAFIKQDISRQQLVDRSTILINDSKVDLKFQ